MTAIAYMLLSSSQEMYKISNYNLKMHRFHIMYITAVLHL